MTTPTPEPEPTMETRHIFDVLLDTGHTLPITAVDWYGGGTASDIVFHNGEPDTDGANARPVVAVVSTPRVVALVQRDTQPERAVQWDGYGNRIPGTERGSSWLPSGPIAGGLPYGAGS